MLLFWLVGIYVIGFRFLSGRLVRTSELRDVRAILGHLGGQGVLALAQGVSLEEFVLKDLVFILEVGFRLSKAAKLIAESLNFIAALVQIRTSLSKFNEGGVIGR
uniref:Uncharacterized protein n=1 Tax=Strombidium inclinatum TaxID=197538 RepID=A0A7S3INX6_9SPIT